MNLRRKTPPDSLYLLLDTLCNAFGGIILLAVLVVLLTSKEKSQSATKSDSQEMLQRRLALAQNNLQESLQLAATLNVKANDPKWKQQIALLSTRKELQDSIQQIHDTVLQNGKELDAANAADPAERLKFLNAELATAQARKLEAENSLAATEDNVKRLKQRLADMEGQVTAKVNELQRPLRLPKEHETEKQSIYIIVRYDHIYPCRNSDLSRNEADINWTIGTDNEVAEPIHGRGLDPNAVGPYFSSLSGNDVYVVFLVFEDSFPAFIRAKQSAIASGISYGWEPFRNEDGPVVFSETGHTTKPQ
jgi:hypothetical protein